ncbi:DUF6279 family lipoprotein [Nitrospinaceae bacterium]|nr:DUF6279 family lipoprotein [Nitrospinaceae bacterium]
MFKSFYLRFIKIYPLMNLNSKNHTILIKLKTGLFIIFSLFVFISCSTTKIAYNFANVVIINWFESYFDFRDEQRLDLKKKVGEFFDWHRKSELPKIVLFLEEFKIRHSDGFLEEDVKWLRSELNLFWKKILNHTKKDMIYFLLTVDDFQILEMNKKFQEKEDDRLIKQSKMTLKELRQDILERTYNNLDNWFGDLEPSQKNRIAKWIQPDPYWVAVKLRNREKFQNDLIDLLRSKETLKQNTQSWMSDPESHWTAEYKVYVKKKIIEWESITLNIDSIMLPRQRKHIADKLDGIIIDIKELSEI